MCVHWRVGRCNPFTCSTKQAKGSGALSVGQSASAKVATTFILNASVGPVGDALAFNHAGQTWRQFR
jgi:hypothetical protein